jgi:hypothetical protein
VFERSSGLEWIWKNQVVLYLREFVPSLRMVSSNELI